MSLIAVGVFLGGVGLGDLVRAAPGLPRPVRRPLALLVGSVYVVVLLTWLGERGLEWFGLGLGLVLAHLLWLLGSMPSHPPASGTAGALSRLLAGAGLAGGVVTALALVGDLDPDATWPGWLQGTLSERWPVSDVLVAIGVVLVQLVTANVLVRLVLDSVVGSAENSQERGPVEPRTGRLLGTLERLLIVGLGAIGQFVAAAIVIAVRAALRFPDLLARARSDSPGDATAAAERFVLGSLASWVIALAGVALIYLA